MHRRIDCYVASDDSYGKYKSIVYLVHFGINLNVHISISHLQSYHFRPSRYEREQLAPASSRPPTVCVSGGKMQILCPDCAADILFVVDATSSVAHYYERHRQYVLDVIGQLSVTPSGHNVGVIVYSSARRQQIRIPFGIHSNNDELITAVKRESECLSGGY
jgi:hypothetical protein